jgi:hypothetical protein
MEGSSMPRSADLNEAGLPSARRVLGWTARSAEAL